MRFDTDPALGGPSGPWALAQGVWLLTGPDRLAMERMALALSRFGIDAQPFSEPPARARHSPVLCDMRLRGAARAWLDDLPRRAAPLVFVGVSAAMARARLIRCGADDAVSARVAVAELAARMQAALRVHAAAQGIVRLAGLQFDTGLRQVRWRGRDIPLMPREFDLLLVLARHVGTAISREALLRAVWRTSFDPGTNSLEVHICKLRRSLAGLGDSVRIETERNQGYRLVCAPEAAARARGVTARA